MKAVTPDQNLVKAYPLIQARFRILNQPYPHLFQGSPGIILMVSGYVLITRVTGIDDEMLLKRPVSFSICASPQLYPTSLGIGRDRNFNGSIYWRQLKSHSKTGAGISIDVLSKSIKPLGFVEKDYHDVQGRDRKTPGKTCSGTWRMDLDISLPHGA